MTFFPNGYEFLKILKNNCLSAIDNHFIHSRSTMYRYKTNTLAPYSLEAIALSKTLIRYNE